jgi:hypothetical protein
MSDNVYGGYLTVASTAFFERLVQNTSSAAEAYARVPHKTLKEYMKSLPNFDLRLVPRFIADTFDSRLTLLAGDSRLAYSCGPPTGERLVDTLSVGARRETAISAVTLAAGSTYRFVVTGTATFSNEFVTQQYDALYCFAGNGCGTPIHFNHQLLAFFLQRPGDTIPDTDQGEWIAIDQFSGAASLPYAGSHTYTAVFTPPETITLVARTAINYGEKDASGFSGSYSIQIFGP